MRNNGETPAGNGSRRPEDILAEIEHTRHEMDSTLTAIEHRLTPGQLVDQGLDYLRSSGANEFVQNLGVQVKNNPLPLSLVGIGLAWLMASSKNPPARYAAESYGPSLSDRAGEMGDKASSMMSSARSKLGDSTQAVGDRMRQARDTLSSVGQSTRQRVSDLGGSARYQIKRARSGMDYMMREQPLALGAVGVAIGALVAAMAPRTRQEDELMGDTRDRLMEKAKEAGQESVQKATDVAKKGIEQAKETTLGKETSGKPATTVGAPSYGDQPTRTVSPTLGADLTPRKPAGGPGHKP